MTFPFSPVHLGHERALLIKVPPIPNRFVTYLHHNDEKRTGHTRNSGSCVSARFSQQPAEEHKNQKPMPELGAKAGESRNRGTGTVMPFLASSSGFLSCCTQSRYLAGMSTRLSARDTHLDADDLAQNDEIPLGNTYRRADLQDT